jgi:hypothetical protein
VKGKRRPWQHGGTGQPRRRQKGNILMIQNSLIIPKGGKPYFSNSLFVINIFQRKISIIFNSFLIRKENHVKVLKEL